SRSCGRSPPAARSGSGVDRADRGLSHRHRPRRLPELRFLKLYTEDGLTGVGEATVEWNELAAEASLRQTCARIGGADAGATGPRGSGATATATGGTTSSSTARSARSTRPAGTSRARSWGRPVAPHNASGPIGTAAVQLDLLIPHFLIQEYFVAQARW